MTEAQQSCKSPQVKSQLENLWKGLSLIFPESSHGKLSSRSMSLNIVAGTFSHNASQGKGNQKALPRKSEQGHLASWRMLLKAWSRHKVSNESLAAGRRVFESGTSLIVWVQYSKWVNYRFKLGLLLKVFQSLTVGRHVNIRRKTTPHFNWKQILQCVCQSKGDTK